MSDNDNPEQTVDDEELEERYSEETHEYTVDLNGKRFALNREARESIQTRAEYEYAENHMFSCYWKVASPDQYADGEWEETIHEAGDPVLVIETEGPMVPWERMDKLDVEMQEVGPESQFDGAGGEREDIDNGNGMKLLPPDDDEDVSQQIGRTHFDVSPQQFEEVPSPDGEDPEKIPPKPMEMGDEPIMVKWIPDHPEIDHSWSAGEAICPMFNVVEWNVQQKANQPRLTKDKDTSHDHWESLLKSHDCEQVGELKASQDVPPSKNDGPSGQVERKGKNQYESGKYGGDNWQI